MSEPSMTSTPRRSKCTTFQAKFRYRSRTKSDLPLLSLLVLVHPHHQARSNRRPRTAFSDFLTHAPKPLVKAKLYAGRLGHTHQSRLQAWCRISSRGIKDLFLWKINGLIGQKGVI